MYKDIQLQIKPLYHNFKRINSNSTECEIIHSHVHKMLLTPRFRQLNTVEDIRFLFVNRGVKS